MFNKGVKIRLFTLISLNVDSSFNIKDRLLKFSVVVLGKGVSDFLVSP